MTVESAVPELSAVEGLLLKLSGPREASPATHEERLARIEKIEKGVIWRGALAGALSGLAAAAGVEIADPLFVEDPAVWTDALPYYAVTLGISGFATIIEIAFLFWDGTRGAIQIGAVAGSLDAESQEEVAEMEVALIHAGLETAPPRTEWRGIDPLEDSSRIRLLLFAALYKAKVGGTSAIVKALVRKAAARLGGRTVARSVVELAAAPVFAIWNAIVCRRVMREARVRALGPAVVQQSYDAVFPQGLGACSPGVQQACLQALREQIVTRGMRHPNVVRLGHRMFTDATVEFDPQNEAGLDDELESLEGDDARQVVELFIILITLDGRVTRKERRLAEEYAARVGITDITKRLELRVEASETGLLRTA